MVSQHKQGYRLLAVKEYPGVCASPLPGAEG